jgi:GTPase
MMFKDSVHQYPNFALYGEPGQQLDLTLELQLFADVALIGTPSVGKSSIINTISNTKAKVADYHFTTLIPHLGSVTVQDHKFNVVDVPGLVEGAAEGK